MKEFMMLFRNTPRADAMPSPEQLQGIMQQWDNWIGGIAAQGKFVRGNRLAPEGKTLAPGNIVTDGPYAEVKEILGGYILVLANTLDEAFEMAHGCPALLVGGYVEVREALARDN